MATVVIPVGGFRGSGLELRISISSVRIEASCHKQVVAAMLSKPRHMFDKVRACYHLVRRFEQEPGLLLRILLIEASMM